VRSLDRKLLRDAGRMRAQLVAVILVVVCGVIAYVTMLSVHASIGRSAEEYFADHRMPDLFAVLKRAPDPVARRIEALPSVTAVQTRIVRDVTLDVEGMPEPAVGRLISVPSDAQPRLARLYVRRGRYLAPDRPDEVLVGEAFAEAHGLEPGDRLRAVIAGRLQTLTIIGIALSPEYVYQIPPGGLFPDDRRFAVIWMSHEAMAAAFDMDGAFNDVMIELEPEADETEIIEHLDRILDPYGSLGAHGRDRQISAHFIAEELKQLEAMGKTMPTIFLAVAAFILNVVISRLVAGQREQIAIIKALGYGNAAIGWHYAKLVLGIAIVGTAIGAAFGSLLGGAMIGLYQRFFRLPDLRFHFDPAILFSATMFSITAGALGTFGAVRRAIRLPPAEAMRPPVPARYRRGIIERLGIGQLLSPAARMVMRNLSRHPVRLLTAVLGIAAAMAIMIMGNFSRDAVDYLMRVNFELMQHEDVTVNFYRDESPRAIDELSHLQGVLFAEGFRDVPIRLSAGHRSYETVLHGMPENSRLRMIPGPNLESLPIPQRGLMLTRPLGQRLDVKLGDLVTFEVLDGRRVRRQVQIVSFSDEMMGLAAYMELHALGDTLGEGTRVTGARLLLDPAKRDLAYLEIKGLPGVAGASLRTAAYDLLRETLKIQIVSSLIMVAFASIVAVGVVYNGARVVLSERSRELASMRVLGFTRIEISWILLGELLTQLVLALPLGCIMGYGFAVGAMAGVDTELYRFPIVIVPRTYAFAAAVTLVVGITAGLLVRRKLDHLDLVEVLKTRE